MSRNQRLSFLGIAAAIALAAVIVLAGGTGPDQTAEEAASTPTPQGTATPAGGDDGGGGEATPEPTPRPRPPLLQAGRERGLRFEEGEMIRFRARSETQEEIHVHGYDRYVDLPPGETVGVSFRATITGIFEIELHGSGEVIGRLRVDPS